MYVWELVSCRLRVGGWNVWHLARQDASGPCYVVHLQGAGISCEVTGPTLTEAYAVAAKRAREFDGMSATVAGPHFPRVAGKVRA